jgi:RNA polymerase sigma-70 factor (sigma-B/F/G subfamily)
LSQIFSTDHLSRQITYLAKRGSCEVSPENRAARTMALLRQAAGADPDDARRLYDEVVVLNLEVAESVVSRYRNRGVPREDLVQVACLGLVKAARGFDPDKSDNFLGYAVPTILGEVKRFFRDSAWVVKPPRRIQELQAELSAASARLTHRTGRIPDPAALAHELDVDVAAVVEALSADGCFAPSSLDHPYRSAESTSATVADSLGDRDPGFDQAEAIVALGPICRRLSMRDRRIVYLRFFCEWTQARIAEEFGVTQMQVSRLLSRILKDLRSQLADAVDLTDTAGPI